MNLFMVFIAWVTMIRNRYKLILYFIIYIFVNFKHLLMMDILSGIPKVSYMTTLPHMHSTWYN